MNRTREKTSRDIQAEKSRERIFQAAVKLLSEKGYVETSISDICRKAGCSIGAFYHHFSSKDKILEEIFYVADEEFKGWNSPDQEAVKGMDLILAYMDSYSRLVMNHGLEFAKHFYTWKNKTFVRKGRAMQTRLLELIKMSVEKEELSLNMSPEDACDLIFMCARGVVFHWCLHEGAFDLSLKMKDTMERILKGLMD